MARAVDDLEPPQARRQRGHDRLALGLRGGPVGVEVALDDEHRAADGTQLGAGVAGSGEAHEPQGPHPARLAQLDQVSFEAQRTTIFTVHVMGGARMGADERRSVVKPDFSLRGADNVWVADASIFPTGLGANPQVTIYALALAAAQEICRRHNASFTLHQQDRSTFPWPD